MTSRAVTSPVLPMVGITAALATLCALTWGYIEDDAFIHLAYARSLIDGEGFAFKGIKSYGDSSPLWVFLLAAGYSLVGDWQLSTKAVAFLSCLFCLFFGAQFFRRLSPSIAREEGWQWLAAGILLLNPYFIFWAFSGMEAVLALGLAFCMFSVTLSDQAGQKKILILCLLSGISVILRAELALASLICMTWVSREIFSQRQQQKPISVSTLALAAVLMGGPIMVWEFYAWTELGSLLPNTFAAKKYVAGARVTLTNGAARLLGLLLLGFGAETICLLLVVCKTLLPTAYRIESGSAATSQRGSLVLMTFVAAWPLLLLLFYLLNSTATQTRYLLIAAPFLTFLAIAMAIDPRGDAGSMQAVRKRYLVLGAILATYLAVDATSVRHHLSNKIRLVTAAGQFADLVKADVSADTAIAAYSIGQLAFQIPNPIVDIGGLIMADAQPYLAKPGQMYCWALAKGARYFVGDSPGPQQGLSPVLKFELPIVGWLFGAAAYDKTEVVVLSRVTAKACDRCRSGTCAKAPGAD